MDKVQYRASCKNRLLEIAIGELDDNIEDAQACTRRVTGVSRAMTLAGFNRGEIAGIISWARREAEASLGKRRQLA